MYKVCFIGVGSIGKRHIWNLYKIFQKREENIQIDICRSGNGKPLEEHIESIVGQTYFDLEDLPNDYDVIFITNPTEYHLDVLQSVNDKAKNFFIEKPLTSIKQLEKFQEIHETEGKIYYVACPLRYTKVIQYAKEHIAKEDVYCIRCISSSYLPEWRPGQDYRDTYSAHKDLGGGVAIDLIHEWDYIKFLFGMPKDVQKLVTRISSLEIDSDDIATYIGEFDDKIVELHLDYFGRVPIREMQIYTAEETIECDLINSQIRYLKRKEVVDLNEERNDFQIAEIQNFIDMIEGKCENTNTMKDAYETLLLTQGVVR